MTSASRPRCLAVALGLTAAVWGAAAVPAGWLVAAVADATGPRTAEAAITQVCLAALLAALGWAWLQAMAAVVEAWRGATSRDRRGGVRRWVLAACGVALVGALTAPAHAAAPRDPPAGAEVLGGLPLPDRPAGPAHAPRGRTVVVRPGDTLWALAASGLPPGAGPGAVTGRWERIHRLNRGVIGPDPDLIRPGQVLRLPRPTANLTTKESS